MATRKVLQGLVDATFRGLAEFVLTTGVTIGAADDIYGSCWFYVAGDTNTTGETVMHIHGDQGSGRCAWLSVNSSLALNVQVTRSRGTSSKFLRGKAGSITQGLHHFAFKIGAGDTLTDTWISVDGVKVVDGTNSGTYDAASSIGSGTMAGLHADKTMRLFAEDAGGTSIGVGAIANVGIWKNRDIWPDIAELARQAQVVGGAFRGIADPYDLSTGRTGLLFAAPLSADLSDRVNGNNGTIPGPAAPYCFLDDVDERAFLYMMLADYYAIRGVKDNGGSAITANNTGGTAGGAGAVTTWVDYSGGRNNLAQATGAQKPGFLQENGGYNRGRFSPMVTFGAAQNGTQANAGDTMRNAACAATRAAVSSSAVKLRRSRFSAAFFGCWSSPCATGIGGTGQYQQTLLSCAGFTLAIGITGNLTYVDADNAAGVAHTTHLVPAATPSLVLFRATSDTTVKIRAHHTEASVTRTYVGEQAATAFNVGLSQASDKGCAMGLHRMCLFAGDIGDSTAAALLSQGSADFSSFPLAPTRAKWHEGSSSRRYYWTQDIVLDAALLSPAMADGLGFCFGRGGDDILGGADSDLEFPAQYNPIDHTCARFTTCRGFTQIGSNDVYVSAAKTLAQTTLDIVYGIGGNGGITDWAAARKAASSSLKKLGVMALLPRTTTPSGTVVTSDEFFARITDVNRELRAVVGTNGIDAFIPIDQRRAVFYLNAFLDSVYFNADQTHLNITGNLEVQPDCDAFWADDDGIYSGERQRGRDADLARARP